VLFRETHALHCRPFHEALKPLRHPPALPLPAIYSSRSNPLRRPGLESCRILAATLFLAKITMSAEKVSLLRDEECSLPDCQSLDKPRQHGLTCCSVGSARQLSYQRGSHILSFLFPAYLLILHLLCFSLAGVSFLAVSRCSSLGLGILGAHRNSTRARATLP
jgi:hypothetical protein